MGAPPPRVWSLVMSSVSTCDQQPPLCLSYPLPFPDYRVGASCSGVILLVHSDRFEWIKRNVPGSGAAPPLYLCNPLTSQRIVIASPGLMPLAFGISADSCFTSFRIMSCGHPEGVAELYDSAVGSWRLVPLPYPLFFEPDTCCYGVRDFVCRNGRFCTLISNNILTYDVHNDRWISMRPPRSCHIFYSTLHVINDCLFMEGSFSKQGNDYRTSKIGISQFDSISNDWLEVSFMPKACAHALRQQSKINRISRSMYTSFSDTDIDHLLFVPVAPFASNAKVTAVIYHVVSRSWTWANVSAAKLDSNDNGSSCNMKGLTYQPSFMALSPSSFSEEE
ncbi:hypothetical protein L7F22_021733 [Adiantum nelumboides]|nr:hypothetical protein [Adiantum nelumboides]